MNGWIDREIGILKLRFNGCRAGKTKGRGRELQMKGEIKCKYPEQKQGNKQETGEETKEEKEKMLRTVG